MNKSNRYALMVEALTELAEEEGTHQTPPIPGLPSLRAVLAEEGSLPHEALFLGMAEDGLPVLLNLFDPVPGPILISGDQASGKTALLQMIAQAVTLLHSPSEVQCNVITPYPEEWDPLKEGQSTFGIYPVQKEETGELLYNLVTWAHNNQGDQLSVVLLIDNIEEAIKLDTQAEQNLRWLLLRGPSRRVWPIVTLNASRAININEWLGFFRTRIFGHIQDSHNVQYIARAANLTLDNLTAGSQFTLREGTNWLNFWAPTID